MKVDDEENNIKMVQKNWLAYIIFNFIFLLGWLLMQINYVGKTGVELVSKWFFSLRISCNKMFVKDNKYLNE